MIVKEKFTLLKGIPNLTRYSSSVIKASEVDSGPRMVFVTVQMSERRISHFSKDYIMKFVSNVQERKSIKLVTLSDYMLPVAYNTPDKGMIINLHSFNTDDISQVDPRNIYGCLVYGICLSSLVTGRVKIPATYASVFVNYLLSVFIRLFGKEYGLVGVYATEIPKLKFLISCYIHTAFFDSGNRENIYRKSATLAGFDYRPELDQFNKFNFSKIEDFIEALSKLKVMPGINRYSFTAKFLKHLGVNFLPAIEDASRFVSILTTSTVSGSTIIPKFIYTYNEREFARIIEISKRMFR